MPPDARRPEEIEQLPRFGRLRWWVEESPAAFSTAGVVSILSLLILWLLSLWDLEPPTTELHISLQPVASPLSPSEPRPEPQGLEEEVPEIVVEKSTAPTVQPPRPEIDLDLQTDSMTPKTAEALREEAEQARRYLEQLAAAARGETASGPAGDPDSTAARVARWVIQYPPVDPVQYAKLLDQFDVELGWVEGQRIEYVSGLSGAVRRRSGTIRAENRIFWFPVGETIPLDELLLQRLRITPRGTIIHFYPKRVERMLARLEREALRERYGTDDLRRVAQTTFAFRRSRGRWSFFVKELQLRVDPAPQNDDATND